MPENTSAAAGGPGRVKLNQKSWKYIRDIHCASSENLNKTAIRNGRKDYTYGMMFRQWERYASVFSALGMTGNNKARVGVIGSPVAEVIFTFYGLNMVGAEISMIPAFTAFNPKRVMKTIRDEKLTDFIITDDFVPPTLLEALLMRKDELGLRNIIFMHIPLKGAGFDPVVTSAHRGAYLNLKRLCDPICMDTLLKIYEDYPVSYTTDESSDSAFILHTSGTTKGTGKPVVLSDRAFNSACSCIQKIQLDLPDPLVTALSVDLGSSYGIIDQLHLSLSMGAAIVAMPIGSLNPGFYHAIPEFKVTFLFCINAMFEAWMKLPEELAPDLSSLKFIAFGGACVTAKDKKRYHEFLEKRGCRDFTLINGYGISEVGGACCLSTADIEDEAIGYLLPGIDIRLYDEENDRFLSKKDAPCQGVMFLNSPAMSTPVLDGNVICEERTIDRKSFICTNDAVRMEKDGKLTYLGRSNRYFINNTGIKYESGRVETEVSRQPGIESCGVVPVFDKMMHDNIPMLCVTTLKGDVPPEEVVRRALVQIFVKDKALSADQLPLQVLIADELPRNTNGKLDLYRIGRGEVSGKTYKVKENHLFKCLSDIKLELYDEAKADIIKDAIKYIAADMKDGLPFIKSKTEDYDMNQNMNPFASFNAMNQMGNRMMMNMMNMMGRMNQPRNNQYCNNQPCNNQPGSSQPQQPFNGMPFYPSWNVQQINQMINMINQNNQQCWQMIQVMYTQNCQMLQQLFRMMPGMFNMPYQNMPFSNIPNAPIAQPDAEGEKETEG